VWHVHRIAIGCDESNAAYLKPGNDAMYAMDTPTRLQYRPIEPDRVSASAGWGQARVFGSLREAGENGDDGNSPSRLRAWILTVTGEALKPERIQAMWAGAGRNLADLKRQVRSGSHG
jgi:hypothetical protein